MHEVARFEEAGDTRVMRIGTRGAGSLVIEEVIAGKSCLIAYGESSHAARMIFDATSCDDLVVALGCSGEAAAALEEFARREENALVDLMDVCDSHDVPYAFMGVGDASGIQYRG